jgi:hypothetical protein
VGSDVLIATGQSEMEAFDKELPLFETMVQSMEILNE